MFELYTALCAVVCLLFIAIMTVKSINNKRTGKRHIPKWKKKKFHVIKNDKTKGYIDSAWDEIE